MSFGKIIPLTQGKAAIVDAEDYDLIMQWKWYAYYCPQNRTWYAARNTPRCGGKSTISMHNFLMGGSKGKEVDHANGNGLDNRRSFNLRLCTHQQNLFNRGKNKNNTSGYKGVSLHRQTGKWRASIKFNGKEISLGLFHEKHDAAQAYKKAAISIAGEFARSA